MSFNWGKRFIAFVVVLHLAYFLTEICLSAWTNSIALTADSYRILTDGLALCVGIVTSWVGQDRSDRNTFGWARIYVLGSFIRGTLTIALFFTVVTNAVQRLVETQELNDPFLVITMGAVGLSFNLLCLVLFGSRSYAHVLREKKQRFAEEGLGDHGDGDNDDVDDGVYDDGDDEARRKGEVLEGKFLTQPLSPQSTEKMKGDAEEKEPFNKDRNEKAAKLSFTRKRKISMCFVILHVIGSNFGSLTLILSGVLTLYGEGQWCHYADPLLTIVMISIIIISDAPLLHRSAHTMLQTVPQDFNVIKLKEDIKKQIPEVRNIHEFHIWQLTDDTLVTTLHYIAPPEDLLSSFRKIKQFLRRAGIRHITIQPEISCGDKADENEKDCLLCSVCTNAQCSKLTCCDLVQKTLDQITSTDMELCMHSPQDENTGQLHHHVHQTYHHHHHRMNNKTQSIEVSILE